MKNHVAIIVLVLGCSVVACIGSRGPTHVGGASPASTGAARVSYDSARFAVPLNGTRFVNPMALVVNPDSEKGLRGEPTRRPIFPPNEHGTGATATMVVVFVVDTTGRVELPTASFLVHAPTRDFEDAVCEFLPSIRYSRVSGAPRRSLLALDIGFAELSVPKPLPNRNGPTALERTLPGPPSRSQMPPPAAKPAGWEALRDGPRDDLIKFLNGLSHCG